MYHIKIILILQKFKIRENNIGTRNYYILISSSQFIIDTYIINMVFNFRYLSQILK